MEIIDKPPKLKLRTVADVYFYQHPHAVIVGIRTKEGREFWFRRDPHSGRSVKVSREQAEI
jgi:hypothetical protein